MLIRKLSRKAGKAVVSVWPPPWASAYKGADKMAVGEVGVLKGVKHLGKRRLSLTIEYDGREHRQPGMGRAAESRGCGVSAQG